jgi:competence protein ComEC
MPTIHFLNVRNGDCSIIEHYSGRTTVIDVCNAKPITSFAEMVETLLGAQAAREEGGSGDFHQKEYPVNPILYMRKHGLADVFRFILTHADMDHMGGIRAFFEALPPTNFWDTDNTEEKDFGSGSGGHDEDDWKFYVRLRDGKPTSDPKRLTLYSGNEGKYFNQNETQSPGGDGLHVLAPTAALVASGNECMDFNDCSYVILYKTDNHKILFAGDSHDDTWEHILSAHSDFVRNVDLLIAPHHGRDSGRDWQFLDVVNPVLTLFGNAHSDHLAYGAWNRRKLKFITNNQAGSIIIGTDPDKLSVYVTCEAFAKESNPWTFYSESTKAHFWGLVKRQ